VDLEDGVGGPNHGVWGTEVPQWAPGAKPRQEVWGWSPPEAGAFSKMHNLNFKAL